MTFVGPHELDTAEAGTLVRVSELPNGHLLVSGSDGEPSSEVSEPVELANVVRLTRARTVVLDLRLPIHLGLRLLRVLQSVCPDAEILALVRRSSGEPSFYSVTLEEPGLSLRPFGEPIRAFPFAGRRSSP